MADPRQITPLGQRWSFPLTRKLNARRRPGLITALDIDGQLLRVVQALPRGNRTVVTRIALASLEIEPEQRQDPTALGRAIAKSLDQLRLKPGPVVMGLPRNMVILRTLSLPAIDDLREMASMVHLQIAKDLPFRLEEAVIDFKVRRQITPPAKKTNGPASDATSDSPAPLKSEVLVAAVRRDAVVFFQQVASAAKLKLVALGWLSQAHARCVEACRLAEKGEGLALVSLRSDEVGIDVIVQDSLLFSRGAPIKPAAHPPATDNNDAPSQPGAMPQPSCLETVRIEVVRSLHGYNGIEPEAPVAKLFIAGETGQENAILEALQSRLNLPCTLFNASCVPDLPKEARQHASGSLAALGLALGVTDPHGLPFDFLNPKRPAVQRNMRRIRLLAAATAGAVLLVSLLAVRSHLLSKRENVYRQIQSEVVAAEKQRPLYRQMQQQSATIQSWINGGRDWLDHYAFLSAILPSSEDIYITSLSISSRGNIHLAVQARSGEILAAMDKQLRAAGYQVKPLAIHPGSDKFGYPFRSTVELIVPPNLQIDLAKARPPARPADDTPPAGSDKPPRKGGRS
jgi:Tfp pilus assembly PilM family ATPase